MYNQEIKEKYLASLSSGTNEVLIVSVLNRVGVYEEILSKDVGDFQKGDVSDYLYSIKTSKARTLYNYSMILRNYTIWYKKNIKGEVNPDVWKFSTKEIEEKIISDNSKPSTQTISNKESVDCDILSKDLIDYIASIQENPVNKLIIYSLYYGIAGRSYIELITLSKTSIISKNELQLLDLGEDSIIEGRKIKVPEFLIELLLLSCDTYHLDNIYMYRGKLKKQKRQLYGSYGVKAAKADDEILSLGSKYTNDWLRRHYQIIQKRLDGSNLPNGKISLKAGNIYNSGFVNTVKMYGEVLNISPNEVLNHPVFEKISQQYGKYGQDISQIRYTYKKYLY